MINNVLTSLSSQVLVWLCNERLGLGVARPATPDFCPQVDMNRANYGRCGATHLQSNYVPTAAVESMNYGESMADKKSLSVLRLDGQRFNCRSILLSGKPFGRLDGMPIFLEPMVVCDCYLFAVGCPGMPVIIKCQ